MFYEYQNFTPLLCVVFLGVAIYLGMVRLSLPGVMVSLGMLFAGVSAIDSRWPKLWYIPAIATGLLAVVTILLIVDQVLFERALNRWRRGRWDELQNGKD